MNPRLRTSLFAAIGVAVALMIGIDIADDSYGLASVLALVSIWLIVKRVSPVPPAAWVIAIVVTGYVVGNRGFAQFQVTPSLPILPAEAALLVAVPALLLRIAFKGTQGIQRDALNYSILIWIVLGSVRLPADVRNYGFLALRDFAMIYYSAFFFVAQDFGHDSGAGRLLRRSITVAFILLLPVVISIQISPTFLLDNFTWHGIPLIFHKSDLIATSLAAGFFWLWTRWDKTHSSSWFLAAAASLLLVAVMPSPRAGMLGLFVVTILWIAVGRWRIAAAQVGIAASAALLSLGLVVASGKSVQTSVPYSMYEHVASFFDPAGTGTYINGESGDLGGNNQFRLIWWRDVIEDTLSTNPALGLGFGSDLSTRFLADYDLLNDENFAARSPHSIIVTVIGRMGIVGFLAWAAIMVNVATLVWRLMKSGDADKMGLAGLIAVVLISACFGVVLEGPMGAVLFWTALGLGNSYPRSKVLVEAKAVEGSDNWPVAKPVAIDTH
jgi:hypothetical protein